MLFDKFCGFSEKHVPELKRKLERVALFEIRETWEQSFAKGISVSYEEIFRDFRTPFSLCAFEDPDGLVMFESNDNDKPGISSKLFDVWIYQNKFDIETVINVELTGVQLEKITDKSKNVVVIPKNKANLSLTNDAALAHDELVGSDGLVVEYKIKRLYQKRAGELRSAFDVEVKEALHLDVQSNIIVAFRQAMLVIRPSNWVLKSSPAKPQKPGQPKIARSHQRDRYLLISDEERVRYFNNNPTPGAKKSPHPRRAHYRRIENESGKKVVWVRACWVGSEEAMVCGAKYKVMLDL